MKHAEKEHLKENEVAQALLAANQHRNQLLAIGGGILVLLVAIGGFITWQRNKDATVSALLADAMVIAESPVQAATPGVDQPAGSFATLKARHEAALPKFLAAADSSPSSAPGRLARLNAAAILVELGRFDEARAQYEQLTAGSDIVAAGATLGKAQALARAGQYGPAIDTLKTMSTQTGGLMPVDGVLLELARTYQASGKVDDARKTFTELVEKHADSPLVPQAKSELEKLKS